LNFEALFVGVWEGKHY